MSAGAPMADEPRKLVPCPKCTAVLGTGPGRTLAVLCPCQDTDTPGWVDADKPDAALRSLLPEETDG